MNVLIFFYFYNDYALEFFFCSSHFCTVIYKAQNFAQINGLKRNEIWIWLEYLSFNNFF